jgi:hypothetical protein
MIKSPEESLKIKTKPPQGGRDRPNKNRMEIDLCTNTKLLTRTPTKKMLSSAIPTQTLASVEK